MVDALELEEADDMLDSFERGYFDFNRPDDEVIADLMKMARLAVQLRKWVDKTA